MPAFVVMTKEVSFLPHLWRLYKAASVLKTMTDENQLEFRPYGLSEQKSVLTVDEIAAGNTV